MYRARSPSRVQVARAVATWPPGSTRTSRICVFVLMRGNSGTTQIVSIAFKPRPTTSIVLFFKVIFVSYGSPIERFDYIEDIPAWRGRSDRRIFQPRLWKAARGGERRAQDEKPVWRVARAAGAFPDPVFREGKQGSGADSVCRSAGF